MGKKINPGASAPKTESSKGKRILALAAMGLGMLGLMFLARMIVTSKQEEVSVIRLNRAVNAGDIITEDMIEEYPMLKNTYDTLGVTKHLNAEGKEETSQVILLWSQRDQLLASDKNGDGVKESAAYFANYLSSGAYITALDVTDEITIRNPWVAEMEQDEEIFTMSFDAESVNPRLLYPGTRLRARLIAPVPNDMVEDARNLVEKNEATDSGIVRPSTVLGGSINTDDSDADGETQIAEIVIDEIVITDMTNSAGESIYDLYMSLLKLPVTQRISYLKTELGDNKTSSEWQERVTPTSITFILDKESASLLAEFEQGDGTIKYTILPDDPEQSEATKNLMSKFVEIGNQINTTLENN